MSLLSVRCEVDDDPLPIRACAESMLDLAYTTTATVLNNLKQKGMVEQLRDQPILRWRPARSVDNVIDPRCRAELGAVLREVLRET